MRHEKYQQNKNIKSVSGFANLLTLLGVVVSSNDKKKLSNGQLYTMQYAYILILE